MLDVTLRPLTDDDVPEVVALVNRSQAHDGVDQVVMEAEYREELADLDLDLDTRVAVLTGDGDGDAGRIVGVASTLYLPSEELHERCYVFGSVDPDHRRQGVGRTLLAWSIDRGLAQLASSERDLPRYLRAESYDWLTADHRLFERFGFVPVRWFEELLRSLDDVPSRREVPGIRIESWPDEADGRDGEILAVKNASFADHWGTTPTSADHWRTKVRGFGSRPDLSTIAVDTATGDVVGFALAHRYDEDDALSGRRDGWVDTLGTLRGWRGRGIASALLVESFHRFAADGLTHAALGVDADSPTGAARLYRNVGFVRHRGSMTLEYRP